IWADVATWLQSLEVRAFVCDITMDEQSSTPDGDNAFRLGLQESGMRTYLGFNVHPEAPKPPAVEKPVNRTAPQSEAKPDASDDGKLRTTRFAYTDGVNRYVTLPVAVVADLWGAKDITLSPGHLKIGDHDLKVDLDGSAKIDYRGVFSERFGTMKLARALQCYW